ncbi:MAG: RecX family transcriptional regulator, partial [Bacilli bacterium]|nr:RecX family transcriptional regulator [Bacilli bacterium]
MKIEKYKKMSKGRYQLLLDNGEKLVLYEEVILKFELLLKKEIDVNTMIEVDKLNQEWDVYYQGLNSLRVRYKSIYELELFLLKKEYPQDLVDKSIHKLMEQGYLNDRSFTKGYIHNKMVTSNSGPNKIEKELLDKKIDLSIISEEMKVFTREEQEIKVKKIIEKEIRSNRNRGGIVLKNKIYHDLIQYGYDSSISTSILSSYTFDTDSSLY